MNWGGAARTTLVFLALVVLHFTLRPVLGWRAGFDFLVIGVLLTAVRVRPAAAALIGFAAGLLADSLAPGSFGAGALAMTLIGSAASWLKAVFFADNVVLHAFFFFSGKWAFDIVFLLAARQLDGWKSVTELLVWSPLAAALTAAMGVALLLIVGGALEPRRA